MRAVFIALALSWLCCACATPRRPPTPDAGTLPHELARVLTDYEAAWQAKDPVRLANLFAEDGYVLSNGHPPVQGRAAIREFYTGKGGPLSLRAITWRTSSTVGYIIGSYASEPQQEAAGKFTLTLWRDEYRHWWIVSDMDNGNAPSK